MSIKKIISDLKEKNFAPIYYLFGQEQYLKEYYYKELRKKISGEMSEFNCYEVYEDDLDLSLLADRINAVPFMSETKFIGIVDIPKVFFSEQNCLLLSEILSNIPECCTVVVFDKYADGEKREELSKLVKKLNAVEIDCVAPSPANLAAWAKRHFKSAHKQISNSDINYMISITNSDMLSLKNEINKICAYVEDDTITRKAIDEIVTKNIHYQYFEIINAIRERKSEQAFKLIDNFYKHGYTPHQISNFISLAVIDMFRGKLVSLSGHSSVRLTKDFKIHPYAASKIINTVATMEKSYILFAINRCAMLEASLRQQNSDKRDLIVACVADLLKGQA